MTASSTDPVGFVLGSKVKKLFATVSTLKDDKETAVLDGKAICLYTPLFECEKTTDGS